MTLLERIAVMAIIMTVQTVLIFLIALIPEYQHIWLAVWLALAVAFWWQYNQALRS